MKGLKHSDNVVPAAADRHCLRFSVVWGLLALPSPPGPLQKTERGDREPESGRGFPGDTPPCPPGSAPGPPAPPPSAAAGRGRAAPSERLRRGWGKLRRQVAFLRRRWLDRFNKSLFFLSLSRSLALPRDTGGGVHPHRRARKRRTRRERRRPPGSPARLTVGPRRRRSPRSAGPRSRASAPPRPPRSRPGSSEGISGPPARLGGPGAMLTRGLGNA